MTSSAQKGPALLAERRTRRSGLLGGALLLFVIASAALLEGSDPDLYYRLVQEDEVVEWATVWFLLFASAGFAWEARGAPSLQSTAALLLALFCFVVAGEEVSWGQRLLGYQPPAVFLEHNDQQELNLHNTLPKGIRKLALPAFLVGFGVVLPLLASVSGIREWLGRIGLRAPDIGLAVGFSATAALYLVYPWRFTGEWVELSLAAGLAVHAILGLPPALFRSGSLLALRPLLAFGLAGILALGTSVWAREGRRIDPQRVSAARLELEALREDFRHGRLPSHCGLHKRLYRHIEARDELVTFRALSKRGLPEERAEFFLDPWNSPYWIRDHCSEDGGRRVVVYSLGGNRLREATAEKGGGDDLIVELANAVPAMR